MAQYKVPQDVEAEDKLLGPFTFRQFIYLMIIGGLIGLGVLLWGIFPPLVIILVPPILLLGALALPLKKDQPMETYLSAVVSFYLKPHVRTWEPGEPESTITITAPKQTEEKHIKDLDQDEAMHRLSFLADIIDTEGYAIKGITPNNGVKEEIYAEANSTMDMFDNPTASNNSISQTLQDNAASRHTAAINQMRTAIENSQQLTQAAIQANQSISPASQTTAQSQPINPSPALSSVQSTPTSMPPSPQPPALPQNPTITEPIVSTNQSLETPVENPLNDTAIKTNDIIIKPDSTTTETETEEKSVTTEAVAKPETERKTAPEQTDPSLLDLANNNDFSIETIAKQAKRIQEKKNDEVYISLRS